MAREKGRRWNLRRGLERLRDQRRGSGKNRAFTKAKLAGKGSVEVLCNPPWKEQHGLSSTYDSSVKRQAVDLLICYIFTPNTRGEKNICSRLLPVGSGRGCVSGPRSVGTPAKSHPRIYSAADAQPRHHGAPVLPNHTHACAE